MKLLACIDGSEWSVQALCYLVQQRQPADLLILLYVAPRAGLGYLEAGRMVLEAALRRCRLCSSDPCVRCRLEIGDPAGRILAVCREERPDVLAMGYMGAGGFPHLAEMGEVTRAVWAECACPLLVASPGGIELLVAEERVLTGPRMPGMLPAEAVEQGPSPSSDVPARG